ncbi:hypothetical protein VTN31DRAFT_7211 [Thermomyces dupontii]|uniref:uncharacterized protein n=1 Tax=Talaromyces thermophilus TaxID=28565 RepID=UPI0037433193
MDTTAVSYSSTLEGPLATFTPALEPPPGVVSNPINPPSLAYQSKITIGIAVPLTSLFFFARCYVRLMIKRTWILEDCRYDSILRDYGSDDVAPWGSACLGYNRGTGSTGFICLWFNVSSIEYGVTICLTKLAILWLYRRVFSPVRWSLFDSLCVFLIVICIGFYSITSFVKIFECTPRAKIVNPKIPGHCVDISRLLNTSGLFNTITDFLILLLPVHAVWNLHLTRLKKFLVVLVFTFGLCAPIFSTVGFVVRLKRSGNPDTTWNQPEILLWGAAELTSGNLVFCFPELGVLLNKRARKRSLAKRPTTSLLQASAEAVAAARARHKLKQQRDPYIELEEDRLYGVRVSPAGSKSELHEPEEGTVQVRHDITVESERVDAKSKE